MATGEVINQLLHHVGAMCIHQLNLLAASSNSLPLGALLGKQHPIEARHFSSICDIMEKAMVNGDSCIIRCILVVFQVSVTNPRQAEGNALRVAPEVRFFPRAVFRRWCFDFLTPSPSRTRRACAELAFCCGSFLWLLWITSDQTFKGRCAWPSGRS